VWDIRDFSTGTYVQPDEMKEICEKHQLTYTPVVYHYKPDVGQTFVNPFEFASSFMEKVNNPSFVAQKDWEKSELPDYRPLLGGKLIEGLVLKVLKFAPPPEGYKYPPVGRVSKIVYKVFHERVATTKVKPVKEPKQAQTFEQMMMDAGKVYDAPARYEKAQQHLREQSADEYILTCLKEHKWNDPKLFEAMEEELSKDLCKEKMMSILSMLFYSQATELICVIASHRLCIEDWAKGKEKVHGVATLYQEIANISVLPHIADSPLKKEIILLGLQFANQSLYDVAIVEKYPEGIPRLQKHFREYLRTTQKEMLSQKLFDIMSTFIFKGASYSLPVFLQKKLAESEEKVPT
jgi:hypothetical protein